MRLPSIKNIHFFVFVALFSLLLFFQNCGYFGNVLTDQQLLTFHSGNGLGYDGKLRFVITHKDQKILSNQLSMYSGETMSIEVLGGTPPYNYSVDGNGSFELATQSYTAPFYPTSPQFENINVTDSLGASGTIQIQIHSFYGKNKLMFPLPGSLAPITHYSDLKQNANGHLFVVANYTDFQQNTHSILRSSNNFGKSWISLKKFKNFQAQVFINPHNNHLYLASANFHQIQISTDDASSWTTVTPLGVRPLAGQYLTLNGLLFLSSKDILAYGSYKEPNSVPAWMVMKSTDAGYSWFVVDKIYDGATSFRNATAQAIVQTSDNEIYLGGHLGMPGGSATSLLVRKSLDGGNSWTDDFTFRNTDNPLNFAKLHSLDVDSKGHLYLSATVTDGGPQYPHWNIFKKTKGQNTWSLVKDFNYTRSASDPYLTIRKNDDILITGSGFANPTSNSSSIDSSRQLMMRSRDAGATWELIQDEVIQSPSITQSQGVYRLSHRPIIEDTSGNLLSVGTRVNHYQSTSLIYLSTDNGNTWNIQNEFQALSELGGDFIAKDFIQYDENTLFLAGSGSDPESSNLPIWLVLKSTDKGETWSISDQYIGTYDDSSRPIGATAYSILKDSQNNLFVSGQYNGFRGSSVAIVRKSADGGKTWNTVDENKNPLDISSLYLNHMQAMTASDNNHIYALGALLSLGANITNQTPSSNNIYEIKTLIKKSSDAGKTWMTVHKSATPQNPMTIQNCFNDITFVITHEKNGFYHISKSTDGGSSWKNLTPALPTVLHKEVIVPEILCHGTDNIGFFTYALQDDRYSLALELSYLSNYSPQYQLRFRVPSNITYYSSSDRGETWTSNPIQWKQDELQFFTPHSVYFKDHYFWFAGYLNVPDESKRDNVAKKRWMAIRASEDFSESFIIDQLPEDQPSSSAVKIKPCLNGFCLLGYNTESNNQEAFSIFRYVESYQ